MKNRKSHATTIAPRVKKRVMSEMDAGMSGNSSRMTNYTTPGPSLQAMQQQIEMDRLNSIPFKNNAVELFDRRRYEIPMEVDRQEMDGMLMERPTVDDQVQPVRRVTKK
jgi:hypothetical protein